jgi:pentafunctional AROM polypeptide
MEPERVSVLGKDSVVLNFGLWKNYVLDDLLTNLPSSTYFLVTDTNIGKLYVPPFETAFEKACLERPPSQDKPRLTLKTGCSIKNHHVAAILS